MIVLKNISQSGIYIGDRLYMPGEKILLDEKDLNKVAAIYWEKKFVSRDINEPVIKAKDPILEVASTTPEQSLDGKFEMPITTQPGQKNGGEFVAPFSANPDLSKVNKDAILTDGVISMNSDVDIEKLEQEDPEIYEGTGHAPEPEENFDNIDADKVIAQHLGNIIKKDENLKPPFQGVAVPVIEHLNQEMQKSAEEIAKELNSAFQKSLSDTDIQAIKTEILQSQDPGYLKNLINVNSDNIIRELATQRLKELGQ